jgi:hypothetical protein
MRAGSSMLVPGRDTESPKYMLVEPGILAPMLVGKSLSLCEIVLLFDEALEMAPCLPIAGRATAGVLEGTSRLRVGGPEQGLPP